MSSGEQVVPIPSNSSRNLQRSHIHAPRYATLGCLGQLGPGLQRRVLGPDVDAGQGEPGQRKLPPGAVVLNLHVEVEVSGVEEEQGALTHRALSGFNL